MHISIQIDASVQEPELTIRAPQLTSEIERIIASLRLLSQQITVTRNGETVILDAASVMYAESVDRKTFIYTKDACYETDLRLYEAEQLLCRCGFVRVSKSCLVQLQTVRALQTEIGRKLRLTLENGEQIIVSRQYADEIRQRLEVI